MRIMFLTSEGFDTPNSINHLVTQLCEDILKAQHKLYIVSSHKTGTYSDTPAVLERYDNLVHDVITRKLIDKNKFVRRYLDEVRYALKACKQWRKRKGQIDIVVLQSNPSSVVHAVLIKLFLRVPIVLNLYDVFPGHADRIGVINNRIVYKVLQIIQRFLYYLCSIIITISDEMSELLVAERVKSQKLVVIPNWYDDQIIQVIPRSQNRFVTKYQIPDGLFYVQYAGLLGYVLDADLMLDVAEELMDDRNIRFMLIGDGNKREDVLNQIKQRGLSNIDYYPWQPLEIINDVYNACDVGIIPLKEGVIGNGFPSKVCQLMALKKVVVNSVEPSKYGDLFGDYNMGVTVSSGDPKEVAEEIRKLSLSPTQCAIFGENAQVYSRENFARSSNTKLFISVLENVVTCLV